MSEFTQTQLNALNADETFHERISNDTEIQRLWSASRRSVDDRLAEFALAMGGAIVIDDVITLPPPVAGMLAMLGTIESPILTGETIESIDIDIALRVFVLGLEAFDTISSYEELKYACVGACAIAGVECNSVLTAIYDTISIAMRANERIPKSVTSVGERCRFDLAWLALYASRVSDAANISSNDAIWSLPLAMGAHYIVAYHEKNGGKTYEPNDCKKILDRLRELMQEQITARGYE